MTCPDLSCLDAPCPILCSFVLCYLVLFCLVLFCLSLARRYRPEVNCFVFARSCLCLASTLLTVPSCVVLSPMREHSPILSLSVFFSVLSYFDFPSCFVLSCFDFPSCLLLPCLFLLSFCSLVLPCLVLSCPALFCPVLPCPILS